MLLALVPQVEDLSVGPRLGSERFQAQEVLSREGLGIDCCIIGVDVERLKIKRRL